MLNLITILAIATWCSTILIPTVAHPGLVQHHEIEDKETHHPHKATSYQSIELEHYHAIPTYVKKEYTHLLKHPIHKGKTSADVKVHHGHKHDPGHAITNTHTSAHKGKELHHISHEPIEYKHQEVHHVEPEEETPHQHYHVPIQHYSHQLYHGAPHHVEAGAEFSQAHAAIALVEHGAGQEYRSGYGHQEQGQARAANGDEKEVEGRPIEKQYYYQPVQVQYEGHQGGEHQRVEESSPKEYQHTVEQRGH